MSVKPIYPLRYQCKCEWDDCGNEWETDGEFIPDRCYKCGRHTWNGINKSPKHFVTAKGKTLTLSEWSRLTGVSRATIRYRLNQNWTPDEALGFTARKRKST